jgi:secreted trypsin-like serine protease
MKRFALFLLAAVTFGPAPAPAGQPRIMGGGPAPSGAFPWMTAILEKHTADNWVAQFAGGSLIHPRWVLTAAHIVDGQKAADLQVIVGATDLDAAGLQRINVLEIVRFPGYLPTGFDADAALLLLETPVTGVTPLEIISDPALTAPNTVATTLGWGSLSNAENDFGTPILQSVELPIVDQVLANSASWHNGALTANMMAAGLAAGGKDSCSGDSGGPLVIRGPRGQWVQAGIVSWGEGCGLPMKPGVYTRLSKFRQWVQSYVWPGFNAWETTRGVDTDDGPDIDSDGATQWEEYALGRDPLRPFDYPALLQAGFNVQADHLYPTLTLRRPAAGGNLAWSLQHSPNLQSWSPLNPAAQQVGSPVPVPGDVASEDITWRGPDGTPSSFLRALASPGTEYYNSRRPLDFPGGVTHALHTGDTLTGGFRTRDYLLTNLPIGEIVTLTLRSSAFNSVLRLVNADNGAVLATSDTNNASGNDEKLTFTPAAGTNYAARVTTQAAGGTGEFTLAAFQLKTGIPSISGNQSLSGTLSSSDPADPFFPGGTYYADDFLFSTLTSNPLTVYLTSSIFDPDLSIINAETGERLLAAAGLQSEGIYSLSAMQTFIPRPGVSYYLRASSSAEVATGAYSIRTTATPTVTAPVSRSGSFTSGDGIDPYWVPEYAILADDFVLTGAPAGVARTVSLTSQTLDTVLEVLDAGNGESIAFNDDADEDTTDSQLIFTPVAGHSYIIRASAYDPKATGNYNLDVD